MLPQPQRGMSYFGLFSHHSGLRERRGHASTAVRPPLIPNADRTSQLPRGLPLPCMQTSEKERLRDSPNDLGFVHSPRQLRSAHPGALLAGSRKGVKRPPALAFHSAVRRENGRPWADPGVTLEVSCAPSACSHLLRPETHALYRARGSPPAQLQFAVGYVDVDDGATPTGEAHRQGPRASKGSC